MSFYAFFWLFGLINNALYVVILSAAFDIAGPSLPKTTVLLADILPCFIVKVISPFLGSPTKTNSHPNYRRRILLLVLLSSIGMFLVSWAKQSLSIAIMGIMLASASSGFGETTFLQLTATYGPKSLEGWSSGTGMAGLLGSGVYMLLISIFSFPVKFTLLLFSVLPLGFLLYFKLPRLPINYTVEIDEESDITHEVLPLRETSVFSFTGNINSTVIALKKLFIPYMFPLTTVYLFEYLINQGVSPTLLFPINSDNPSFFTKYRDMYTTYNTFYQLGVFIARSTAHLLRLKNLYLISLLQFFNLLFAISQSWFYFIHNPIPILFFMLYEGFMGGASYVNTFLNIMDEVNPKEQEFALGATSIADASGILIAALIGLILEPTLCKHQVNDGRDWCTLEK